MHEPISQMRLVEAGAQLYVSPLALEAHGSCLQRSDELAGSFTLMVQTLGDLFVCSGDFPPPSPLACPWVGQTFHSLINPLGVNYAKGRAPKEA